MRGKIALEEQFATEATLGDSHVFGAPVWSALAQRLLDTRDTKRAIEVAKEANDILAEKVRKRPARFAAFADVVDHA